MFKSFALAAAAAFAFSMVPRTEVRAQSDTALRSPYVDRPPYSLHYNYLSGHLALLDHRGRGVREWPRSDAGTPLLVPVPSDRALEVVVEDANSLLYDYSVKAEVVVRRGLRPCREVVSRFVVRGVVLGLKVVTGLTAPSAVAGLLLPPVFDSANSFGVARGPGGRTTLTTANLRGALENITPPIAAFLEFGSSFARMAASIDDSLAVIAELGELMPIDARLGALQHRFDSVMPGLSQPGRVPVLLRARADSVSRHVARLRSLADDVLHGRYEGSRDDRDAVAAVALSLRVDSVEALLRSSCRTLQLALRRIEVARVGSRQRFVVGASPDVRRIALQLRPTSGFAGVLRLRTDAVAVYTEPTVPLVCRIAVGVAWVERSPSYSVSNGTVVDAGQSDRRTSVVLGLRVALPRIPQLALVGGPGLGAGSRPDFFLGASLRLLEPVWFDAGLAWQSQQRLPSGIRVGDSAPAEGLGRLQRTYRSGLFWGVSFSP